MATFTKAPEEKKTEEQGSMSFLEHLDELRTRLIRIALFVLVAFGACWYLSDRIYAFLERPVRAAMVEAKRLDATELKDVTVLPLGALNDGDELEFTFPSDCKIGDNLASAASSVLVQMHGDEKGVIHLVTNRPWLINSKAVLKA